MQQFDFKQKLVDIDTNYLTKLDYGSILWIEYSLNIDLLGTTQSDSESNSYWDGNTKI